MLQRSAALSFSKALLPLRPTTTMVMFVCMKVLIILVLLRIIRCLAWVIALATVVGAGM